MSKNWKEVKEELLSDPEVKKEYDKLDPEYKEKKSKIEKLFENCEGERPEEYDYGKPVGKEEW